MYAKMESQHQSLETQLIWTESLFSVWRFVKSILLCASRAQSFSLVSMIHFQTNLPKSCAHPELVSQSQPGKAISISISNYR